MKREIELGLLYSRSGTYSLISEACRSGALKAIAQINADPAQDFFFSVVERDPRGNVDAYGPLCEEMLRDTGVRHVLGCVTSWSRKEVIPSLEKYGGTLWYAVPYEGFEASDHVVYTHASPNQHLLPLLDWSFAHFGKRAYLIGSNYIWGWEMNRLTREIVLSSGGEVLGERYLPLGGLDISRMIEEIRATRPDFVMNSLIGPSQYAFLEAYRKLGDEDPHFRPETCPVLSCNLTECELPAIPPAAAEGLISAGPYFRGEAAWPPGGGDFGSSHEAAAWASVHALARLLRDRPGAETRPLHELLDEAGATATGIDRATHHTVLPALVAQVQDGQFVTRARYPARAGDPYLSHGREVGAPQGGNLRVVK